MGIILTAILIATILTITMGATITGEVLTDMATVIDPGLQRCSADLLALGTIRVQSMESWDLKRDERFAPIDVITICRRTAESNFSLRAGISRNFQSTIAFLEPQV